MVLLSAANAFAMPGVGFFVIRLQFTFYKAQNNEDWETEARNWIFAMVCWIFLLFTVKTFQRAIFGAMGEKLTLTLRIKIIEEILHKQISWFDREDRAPGIITNIIASNVASLNGMTTEVLVTVFEVVTVAVIGLVAALIISWQACIVSIMCSPIMIIGMYMMATLKWGRKGGRNKNDEEAEVTAYEKANALLSDVIINYRTVISFGQKNVDNINEKFETLLEGPLQDFV